jgi:gluconolactonase
MQILATSLKFPEGPIALQDGSILVVEIERGTLSRVAADGTVSVVADCGGGPNGAAIGPDGRVYICNNGGFTWKTIDGLLRPVGTPDDYVTGSIQTVDLSAGEVHTLYESCNGRRLKGPNDIVFDSHGGFYFTDLGKRREEALERGAIYYASTDGSHIAPIVHPIEQPNGIALSKDEKRLYAAETFSAKVRYWDIDSPGKLHPHNDPFGVGNILYGFQGYERLDSMAVDGDDNICVATLGTGCINVIAANGKLVARVPVPQPDVMVTNICFAGKDSTKAYITSSGRGILYEMDWHCQGHTLAFGA